jgi:hypothetical protein
MRMRILAAAAAVAAVVAYGYALRQLHVERARAAAAMSEAAALREQLEASRQPAPAQAPTTASPAAGRQPIEAPRPALPEYMRTLGPQAQREVEQLLQKANRQTQQFLADLQSSDPATRRRLVAEHASAQRAANPGLAEAFGLTPDEEQAMLELLAEAQLRTTRTALAWPPNPDPKESTAAHEAELRRQQAELFADDARLERYEAYRKSVPERQQVVELRGRLDGRNTLGNEQATQLIAAMYEERQRYIARSLQQPGAGESNSYGPTYVQSSYETGSPPDLEFREAQLRRSAEFVRRLHERAAAILNAEQLHRFDELQAERLKIERFNLERLRDDP